MASAIFLLVLSSGMIAAGTGYVRAARRMRGFRTTEGTVVARKLTTVAGGTREGHWGSGGGYRPKVTYTYVVDGVSHTSDRSSYANRGFKRSIAESQLAAIPAHVEVHYNPAAPGEAYLATNSPRLGVVLVAGGCVGVVFALLLAIS